MESRKAPAGLSYRAISAQFLALHEQDNFTLLPSSSLLHPSVPMSFVMSAGLIQVENDLDSIIATTGGQFAFTQPCFRHFDVKQVGMDCTHLSLFHMSAAFHIGNSERTTILPRLWYFLTQTLRLDPQRLWVSYLDDAEFGRDQRTYDCWIHTGVEPTHLLGLDQDHCFWRQRSTGQIASDGKKCGPHTEVFYERPGFDCNERCGSDGVTAEQNPGLCRCGRFVEVSNSLFIENYIADEHRLIPADTVFSECVIGAERLAMVLQGVRDVQHVDRFDAWRVRLAPFLPEHLTLEQEASVNLVVDHLSAFVKLVEDGAPEPGSGGRRHIMKQLAKGAMQAMLELNLEIPNTLEALPLNKSRTWLLRAWQRYQKQLLSQNSQKQKQPYRKPTQRGEVA